MGERDQGLTAVADLDLPLFISDLRSRVGRLLLAPVREGGRWAVRPRIDEVVFPCDLAGEPGELERISSPDDPVEEAELTEVKAAALAVAMRMSSGLGFAGAIKGVAAAAAAWADGRGEFMGIGAACV